MSILRFFGFGGEESAPAESGSTETVRKIVNELDQMPPEEARFLAAFAFLLSRVANADLDISSDETDAMEKLVVEEGGLRREQAVIVVQIAKSQNLLFGGTEDYLVSKEFAKVASKEDKQRLLRCLFAVGAADESISTAEDNVVRQIAEELNLEHADFIAVRSEFRDRLAVLQKPKDD